MISFTALLTRLAETAVPGMAKAKLSKAKLSLSAFVLLGAMSVAGSDAFSAEKIPLAGPELSALLANGLSVSATDMVGGKNYTARMTYATNGTLSGAVTLVGKVPIDVKGTWKLDGSRVCRTIVPLQPQEVCETWFKSGSNEVTIRVGDTDVGMIRWQ
jgi:hypothetical protein